MSSDQIDQTAKAVESIKDAFHSAVEAYAKAIDAATDDDVKKDVGRLKTDCEHLKSYFNDNNLILAHDEVAWAAAAANDFSTKDEPGLLQDDVALEDRKKSLSDSIAPKFTQIVTRFHLVVSRFGKDFPDRIANHVSEAQAVFKKYKLDKYADDIERIFASIPKDIETCRTLFHDFEPTAQGLYDALMNLCSEDIDNETFKAGVKKQGSASASFAKDLNRFLDEVPRDIN